MGVDIIAGGHSQYNPTMRCATGYSHVCTSHGVTLVGKYIAHHGHRKVYRPRRPFETTGPYIFPQKRFQRDTPKGAATFKLNNDARLGSVSWSK